MAEPGPDAAGRFRPGDRIRTRTIDPAHHTRLPRYARGRLGVVERVQRPFPLPDDRARGIAPPRVERVYTVAFDARELWGDAGEGAHTVTIDLWESYLEPERGDR